MTWRGPIGAGAAVILVLAGCVILAGCGGGSKPVGRSPSTPTATAKARFLQTCLNPADQYLTMAKDFDRATASFSAGGASAAGHALGRVVADVDTFETDLAVLRPHANPDQQAQIARYESVLEGLRTGAQEAAHGGDRAALQAWTEVGRQIAKVPALVGSICNV
jgi:hypothetical protein